MENKEDAIGELFRRLDQLTRQQKIFQDEIRDLQSQLERLKNNSVRALPETRTPDTPAPSMPVSQSVTEKVIVPLSRQASKPPRRSNGKAPWEEFIGTNLLNKVGIAVLVLGIGFGTKYSIDHGLLNPLTRIILGYVSGIALLPILP